ncbi:hypothetical protein D3C72_2057740 [compost metagenome]
MGDVDIPERRVGAALGERRPIHHLQVDGEARELQIFGCNLRHLVVELVLAACQDAQRLALVAGGHQQFGCLFRVGDIIATFRAGFGAPDILRRV